MIIECTSNDPKILPKDIHKYAMPFSDNKDSILDITPGKKYAVYGLMRDGIDWYLVHTDVVNSKSFWWMPAILYKMYEGDKPKGWIIINEEQHAYSFPIMQNWEIYEGVVDGEAAAVAALEESAVKDDTFPGSDKIAQLNKAILHAVSEREREEKHRIAKERGWEPIDL